MCLRNNRMSGSHQKSELPFFILKYIENGTAFCAAGFMTV